MASIPARAAEPVPGPVTDAAVEAAVTALRSGHARAAAPVLEAALAASNPHAANTPELTFWTAEAALATDQPARALALLDSLRAALGPVGDEVQARRARALEALGRHREAVEAWEGVLRDWPRGALARSAAFRLPAAMLACGYGRGAQHGWHRALGRYPQAPEAAAAKLALADYIASSSGSQRAVPLWRQLVPSSDAAVAEAARAQLARLQAAGVLRPASPREELGHVDRLLVRRRLAEASQALDALFDSLVPAQRTPASALASEVALRRGWVLRRRGEVPAARDTWRSLCQQGHASVRPAALQAWAELELAGDRPADAAPLWQQLAEKRRGMPRREALFQRALSLYLSGDDGAASEAMRRYARAFPRDKRADEALWYAGWTAFRSRDYAAADAHLARLIGRFPHGGLRPRAWYWRGRIAAERGQAQAACHAFAQAREDASGYYALLAGHGRERLGCNAGPAAAVPAPPSEAQPVPTYPPPTPAAPAAVAATTVPGAEAAPSALSAAADAGPRSPTAEAPELAWHSPAGWRTAWLMRLGLRREAAQSVLFVPAAANASQQAAMLSRGRLQRALGDCHGAMLTGLGLLKNREGMPPSASAQLAQLQLAYPMAYAPLVQAASREFDVSAALVLAIMRQESAFVPAAESTSMAHGLMQVMPQTGRAIAGRLHESAYTDAAIYSPEVNVRFGAWYLMALLKNYRGEVVPAIAAYNAGPKIVERWLGRAPVQALDAFVENVPYKETRQYIKHVLVNLDVYQQLMGRAPLALPAALQVQPEPFVTF